MDPLTRNLNPTGKFQINSDGLMRIGTCDCCDNEDEFCCFNCSYTESINVTIEGMENSDTPVSDPYDVYDPEFHTNIWSDFNGSYDLPTSVPTYPCLWFNNTAGQAASVVREFHVPVDSNWESYYRSLDIVNLKITGYSTTSSSNRLLTASLRITQWKVPEGTGPPFDVEYYHAAIFFGFSIEHDQVCDVDLPLTLPITSVGIQFRSGSYNAIDEEYWGDFGAANATAVVSCGQEPSGAELGGSAAINMNHWTTGTGGVGIGGSAVESHTSSKEFDEVATGGAIVGGSAGVDFVPDELGM